MSLNIRVNHVRKNQVFHAGDRISGIVVATGPINEDETVVELIFKGKSKTLIKQHNGESTSHYKHKVKFFRMAEVLLRGACKLESDASTAWPFTFELPRYTESGNGNPNIVYSRKANAPYAKSPHLLPPSMSVSGKKRGKACKALISYELRVSLRRSRLFSRSLRQSGSLPVVQCRSRADVDPPDPRMTTYHRAFSHATSRLLPDHASRSRSPREWISDIFTSKAPKVSFSLSARSPRILIEGQAIPIELCLVFDSANSTVSSVPEFKLARVDYEFKEYTNVRALTGFRRLDVTMEPSEIVLRRHLPLMTTTSLKDNEVVDIGAICNVGLLGVHLIPTFNSYSICRSYKAKLIVRVACAGKQFAATFQWKPVVVLPAEVDLPLEEEEERGDQVKELGKATSTGVLDFGDAADVGIGIFEAVAEGVSAFSWLVFLVEIGFGWPFCIGGVLIMLYERYFPAV